jgi:transcriptional regulator with XRE-family HTH domain
MSNLKKIREQSGLSQIELAAKAGVSTSTISLIELGKMANPNKTTLKCIADVLGVDVSELQEE